MPNDAAADRATSSELLSALERDPRPLLFGPGRLGIIWSAKSACTTVLLWYLWHCGLLQAALSYDPWPHRYRTRVLYGSDAHRAWTSDASVSGWSWLRIVRDPYARAVSSYRHALREGYEDGKMTRVLRRPVDSAHGYSFALFLDYLLRIDIAACDGHHRQQTHPVEALVAPSRIINVDKQDLLGCLKTIDRTLPTPPEPVAMLDEAIARNAGYHHAHVSEAGEDHASTPFTTAQAWGAWPSYRQFLNASTRGKIAAIYAADLVRYADHF